MENRKEFYQTLHRYLYKTASHLQIVFFVDINKESSTIRVQKAYSIGQIEPVETISTEWYYPYEETYIGLGDLQLNNFLHKTSNKKFRITTITLYKQHSEEESLFNSKQLRTQDHDYTDDDNQITSIERLDLIIESYFKEKLSQFELEGI